MLICLFDLELWSHKVTHPEGGACQCWQKWQWRAMLITKYSCSSRLQSRIRIWAFFLGCIPAQSHICSLMARNGFVLSDTPSTVGNTLIIFDFATSQTPGSCQPDWERVSAIKTHSSKAHHPLPCHQIDDSDLQKVVLHTSNYSHTQNFILKIAFTCSNTVLQQYTQQWISLWHFHVWSILLTHILCLPVPTSLIFHPDLPLKYFSGNLSLSLIVFLMELCLWLFY